MADYRCSFCGKNQDQVRKLIAGPNRVFICDQCISLCNEIIGDEFSSARARIRLRGAAPGSIDCAA